LGVSVSFEQLANKMTRRAGLNEINHFFIIGILMNHSFTMQYREIHAICKVPDLK
jgi:hypothetical protein